MQKLRWMAVVGMIVLGLGVADSSAQDARSGDCSLRLSLVAEQWQRTAGAWDATAERWTAWVGDENRAAWDAVASGWWAARGAWTTDASFWAEKRFPTS